MGSYGCLRVEKTSVFREIRSVWNLLDVPNGGAGGNRTRDLLNAIQALSQLSYGPTERGS